MTLGITASNSQLSVSYRPIDQLRPSPRNARKHSNTQINLLAKSIATCGFNVPLLVDGEDLVICGHGRLLAARKLGLKELPVIQITHLTPDQIKAFAIADNRLTELSEWDDRILGEIFLDLIDKDIDLDFTGFQPPEIELKIEGLTPVSGEPDPVDQLPEVDGPAVTQAGDIWLLDKHKILCGDATDAASFAQLMGEQLADVVVTDPPYNVRVDGHVSGKGKIQHREFAMASGEMDVVRFTAFLSTVFNHLILYSRNGSIHFIFMDWRHLSEILNAGTPVYSELKNICVWVKDRGGMGSLYRSRHELVLVFKNGAEPHCNNVQLGKFGRNRTNVWEYPSAASASRQTGEDLLALHPTVKPIALIADALMDCSARGNIVLDPFLGSGSTLLAAHRVGRICHGMELDPLYVDVAIRRWQNMTGLSAIHSISGKTFDELERLATQPVAEEVHDE